jgi:hypothetical protein
MKPIYAYVVASLIIPLLFLNPAPLPGDGRDPQAAHQDVTLLLDDEAFTFTPDNTVILANESDASFCRDFSVLLKELRVEWVILNAPEIPAGVQDKHLIIVGRPEAEQTGEIIAGLITPNEADDLRREGEHVVLHKDHPWHAQRTLIIAAGSDLLHAKRAAEDAVASILASVPEREAWLFPNLDKPREQLTAYIDQFQHLPLSDELPQEDLVFDVGAKRPRSLAADEAVADVERLFYLLSNGWCGYGYFQTRGDFDQSKADILARLGEKSRWSPADLSDMIREQLDFIHDCHLRVGDQQYCHHLDFWYDTELELWKSDGDVHFYVDDVAYRLVAVNGKDPAAYLVPSLNAQGEPVYRLGMLAYTAPGPLVLSAQADQENREFDITLQRSDDTLYRDAPTRFGEERIGGIPVLRARSFADYYEADLSRFLQAANTYQGEPYLILDIRGNSGGNTRWPKQWIARFTGRTPALQQVLTELTSKTSMMGRANLFREMLETYPEEQSSWVSGQLRHYEAQADGFERQSSLPYWTPSSYPATHLIPNDATLIVVTDQVVASAGEGLLSYLHRQMENVVIVGENTAGALTFGQVSVHQLPHSKLRVVLPIKLNAATDLKWREERGFLPNLWVPAEEALNYAVAAARAGTISTRALLPPGYFDVPFVPEKAPRPSWVEEHKEHLAVLLLILGVAVTVIVKDRPRFILIFGAIWLPGGVTLIAQGSSEIGYWLIFYGLVYVALGWFKRRQMVVGA